MSILKSLLNPPPPGISILDQAEYGTGWIGGLAAFLVLFFIFIGIWRGLRQPTGATSGQMPGLLRSPLFYLLGSLLFFGVCFLLWKPLPLVFSIPARIAMLLVGSLLFFFGLALTLWARLTLGKNYFVSTGLVAQLFAGHQLVTQGPFAWVRHPMYLGLILACFGGLLLYRTWTFLCLAISFLSLVLRARREEQVLYSKFGQGWLDYCRRTPAWLPRIHRAKHLT